MNEKDNHENSRKSRLPERQIRPLREPLLEPLVYTIEETAKVLNISNKISQKTHCTRPAHPLQRLAENTHSPPANHRFSKTHLCGSKMVSFIQQNAVFSLPKHCLGVKSVADTGLFSLQSISNVSRLTFIVANRVVDTDLSLIIDNYLELILKTKMS